MTTAVRRACDIHMPCQTNWTLFRHLLQVLGCMRCLLWYHRLPHSAPLPVFVSSQRGHMLQQLYRLARGTLVKQANSSYLDFEQVYFDALQLRKPEMHTSILSRMFAMRSERLKNILPMQQRIHISTFCPNPWNQTSSCTHAGQHQVLTSIATVAEWNALSPYMWQKISVVGIIDWELVCGAKRLEK